MSEVIENVQFIFVRSSYMPHGTGKPRCSASDLPSFHTFARPVSDSASSTSRPFTAPENLW